MSDCSSCSSKDKCNRDKGKCMIKTNPYSNIKNIIGVMSGKGGVGKSSIAVSIAKQLNTQGYKVGILDSDITGPSIPRLLGLADKKAYANTENAINPVISEDNIKVMSLNFLMDNEEDPVIWRGPIIAGMVGQFWTDVVWGDLDYLIIDMPPGTGDVALTVLQTIPINGLVMVSVPQDLVSMIVAKAVNMAKKMNVNVLGVIENMSYIICNECGEKMKLFDSDNTAAFLKDMDLELLGELPMTASINNLGRQNAKTCDESLNVLFKPIVDNIIKQL